MGELDEGTALTTSATSVLQIAGVEVLGAGTDREAVETWVGSYKHRSLHTVRSFRREAERFLMWLEATKGPFERLLPTATPEDANRYLDYLGAPRPFSRELLERHRRTEQPFKGPLSRASMRQCIVILHRMFEALRNLPGPGGEGFIRLNPWMLVRDAVTDEGPDDVEEALTFEEWDAVLATIELLPRATDRDAAHYWRSRWLFQLLYRAFLRRDEASALTMGSFEIASDGWRVRIAGKGRKTARIVASRKLMDELGVYRKSLGLPPLPAPGEERPGVMAVIGNERPICDQAIYAICTTIFRATASRLAETDPTAAARLQCATPHWLRHTGISHALERGVDPRYVQAQARHSSLKVTARYDHKEKRRWRDQLEVM